MNTSKSKLQLNSLVNTITCADVAGPKYSIVYITSFQSPLLRNNNTMLHHPLSNNNNILFTIKSKNTTKLGTDSAQNINKYCSNYKHMSINCQTITNKYCSNYKHMSINTA